PQPHPRQGVLARPGPHRRAHPLNQRLGRLVEGVRLLQRLHRLLEQHRHPSSPTVGHAEPPPPGRGATAGRPLLAWAAMAEATWWQRGVIYQIYPRSFMDSDGDGVGDLPGILARLDHLTWLGVDAVWLSPVHPSPMDDFGYDISDHTGVDPVFGTLADLDALVAAAHERGLRVLLDWVPNHTSDRHPWFLESRAS